MALMPKRVKYRKQQRGSNTGIASKGNYVAYGDYGIQSLENAWISARVIESCRLACTHITGGEGQMFIRIFPHKPISATAAETRMGKGKGEVDYWAAVVKAGTILFELKGVSEEIAREVFRRQAHKLPIKVRMVKRYNDETI